MGSLVAGLALSLCVTSADAATKTTTKKKAEKKKETKKKETKKTKSYESSKPKHQSAAKRFVTGTNTMGRSGLLYGDTSDVASVGQIEGSAHLTYSSNGPSVLSTSDVGLPIGGHFGITDNFELSAAAIFDFLSVSSSLPGITLSGSTTNFALDFGGKYRIHTKTDGLNFSLGGDLLIPTNAGGQVVVTPRGTVSYTLAGGLLLNGDMGLHISTATYVSFDAGVGLPVSDKFSIIGEIGANQMGNYGSVLAGGVRAGLSDSFKLQGLLGIPLNGGGVVIGAGIILASK